jgi:putative transposase
MAFWALMTAPLLFFLAAEHGVRTVSLVVIDLVRLAVLTAHRRRSLAAENLFLRKQLALFQERKVKPRQADDATRWMMATVPTKKRRTERPDIFRTW